MALDRQELRDFLATKTRADFSKVGDDDDLFSSGTVDSFAMVDLLVFLEKHTGKSLGLGDVDLEDLDSVERIMSFVAAQAK